MSEPAKPLPPPEPPKDGKRPPPWMTRGPLSVKKGVRGPKVKLTDQLIDDIAMMIMAGNYIDISCVACGITKDTYYRWLKEGALATSGLKKRFTEMCKQATAVAEARDVLALDNAIKAGDAKWAAFRLERRYPKRWGRRDTTAVEHTGAGGGPIVVEERRKALVAIAQDPDLKLAIERIAVALMPPRRHPEISLDESEFVVQDRP